MSVVYRALTKGVGKFVPAKFQPIWQHEAGYCIFVSLVISVHDMIAGVTVVCGLRLSCGGDVFYKIIVNVELLLCSYRPYKVTTTTGAPKLINSDLFLEKRATVPIKTQGVQ